MRVASLLVLFLSAAAMPSTASGRGLFERGFDAGHIRLKVMATSVPVRAGPGGSYREVGRVGSGQVFKAIDRSSDGAWYRIRLSRGTSGWVLSELVWPYEIVDESVLNEASGWLYDYILGQSRLADGNFSLAVSGGALGNDGFFVLRLGFQPSRHYLMEVAVGQSAGTLGNIFSFRAELIVLLGPWRSVVPFAAVGGGGAVFTPHRNVEVFQSGTNPMMSAGGGLMVQLHGSVILRLDARHMMLFSPDDTWGALSLQAGAMLTF